MNLFKNIPNIFSAKRNKKIQPGQFHDGRFKSITYIFYFSFIIIAGRAFIIHLYPNAQDSLKNIATKQYQKNRELAPYRGNIYDKRGTPLAISIKTPSLAVNPRVFDPTKKEVRTLAKLLKISRKRVQKTADRKNYFAWLKRKISHRTAKKIMQMKLKGLYKFMEPARFYPQNFLASNLLGYVGLDNKGLLGLERQFNTILKGESSKIIQSKDARGQNIFYDSSAAAPAKAGHNIYLTIDRVIQEISEEALKKSVKAGRAKGGFAIVADPYTGQILAMANYPHFNPNDHKNLKIKNTTNQAISNTFEPGSIMKPFVVAAAIEQGVTKIDTLYDCEKSGRYKVGRRQYIHDDHPKGALTAGETLVYSSNICVFKIAQKLTAQRLSNAYKDFGFTSKTGLKLPAEQKGRLSNWKHWKPIRFANIAFGQGHTVTGMEVVRAYSSIANGGNLVEPFLINKIESEKGQVIKTTKSSIPHRVMSPETALTLRKALQDVVLKGTARNAKTKHFTTAGKTGTAEKVDPIKKTYSKTKRTASFAGFSPVLDPHIVVFVAIDEPRERPYYGSKWAAPVFSEITEKTLQYLNVAPDIIDKKNISKSEKHDTKNKKM